MAKGQKGQIVTKKHLARQERERLQNRYILIASLVVIILVVGLIGYGIIQQYIIQPNQPVARVTNNDIPTKKFQTYARYLRLQLIQQYQQYEQFAQLFGNDQASLSYIQQYLGQINYQLEPGILGQSALDYLIEDQIIQKEADNRGITVAKEEIDKALQDYFGYYPDGTPTAAPTNISVPTSTEYTLSAYQEDVKTYMANINSFADLSQVEFRWVFGMQLLREKVFEAITADAKLEQDQVWVG